MKNVEELQIHKFPEDSFYLSLISKEKCVKNLKICFCQFSTETRFFPFSGKTVRDRPMNVTLKIVEETPIHNFSEDSTYLSLIIKNLSPKNRDILL